MLSYGLVKREKAKEKGSVKNRLRERSGRGRERERERVILNTGYRS